MYLLFNNIRPIYFFMHFQLTPVEVFSAFSVLCSFSVLLLLTANALTFFVSKMPQIILQPPGLTQRSLPTNERGLTAMLLIMASVWSVGIRNGSRLSKRQVAVAEISLPANNYALYQKRTRRINYYLLILNCSRRCKSLVITSGCK